MSLETTRETFEAYRKFMAIKLHFETDNYDYFKYHGKLKTATPDNLETRRDKYQFYRLSKKDNVEMFLASNFLVGKVGWVGDLFDETHDKVYTETKKRIQSLEYNFRSDMDKFDSMDEAFVVVDGQYPKILKMYRQGEISPETLIILDSAVNLFSYWDSKISDSVVWPMTKRTLKKYSGFFKFDVKKFRNILKEISQNT